MFFFQSFVLLLVPKVLTGFSRLTLLVSARSETTSENVRDFEHVCLHSLSTFEHSLVRSDDTVFVDFFAPTCLDGFLRRPRAARGRRWFPQTQRGELPDVIGVLLVSVLPSIDLPTLLHDFARAEVRIERGELLKRTPARTTRVAALPPHVLRCESDSRPPAHSSSSTATFSAPKRPRLIVDGRVEKQSQIAQAAYLQTCFAFTSLRAIRMVASACTKVSSSHSFTGRVSMPEYSQFPPRAPSPGPSY